MPARRTAEAATSENARQSKLAGGRNAVDAQTRPSEPADENGPFLVRLPYPPSVNHLWRRVGNRTLLSAEGRRYHETVGAFVRAHGGTAPPPPHAVLIVAVVPDRRRRDIDNLLKGLLDPLYRAIGMDDSVIRWLAIEKRATDELGARVEVEITSLAPADATGEG